MFPTKKVQHTLKMRLSSINPFAPFYSNRSGACKITAGGNIVSLCFY
jgi:hypothetical protein